MITLQRHSVIALLAADRKSHLLAHSTSNYVRVVDVLTIGAGTDSVPLLFGKVDGLAKKASWSHRGLLCPLSGPLGGWLSWTRTIFLVASYHLPDCRVWVYRSYWIVAQRTPLFTHSLKSSSLK